LATIVSSLAALKSPYPERENKVYGPFSATSQRLDRWIDSRRLGLGTELFLKRFDQHQIELEKKFDSTLLPATLRAISRKLRLAIQAAPNGTQAFVFGDDVLIEVLSTIAFVFKQTHGIQLRSTQVLAARAMLNARLVEMATGEGKTYAAALAAAAAALAAIPVHVMTANEYLAVRDAQNLAPFFQRLGLSCTSIVQSMERAQRRDAYQHDIVYCTASEVIFDYLRDRMAGAGAGSLKQRLASVQSEPFDAPVLRGLCFALIDEADSILIDDACTPFILAAAVDRNQNLVIDHALIIAKRLLADRDYTRSKIDKKVQLTLGGKQRLADAAIVDDALWQKNTRYREEMIALALSALHCFEKNRDYVVEDEEIKIVDANTGRIAVGRQWSRGLHQLIEAKEGVAGTQDQRTIIQLSFQRFFPRYLMLAGMSGTLNESAAELRRTYGLAIEKIAPFTKNLRRQSPAQLFLDASALDAHLLRLINQCRQNGQPILIGVDSVGESLRVSRLLNEQGFKHALLNASEHAQEAKIIAKAGERGCITVATNMAGRGTDIALGDSVASLGGLLVISCQSNSSRRIDRQLSGRSGRRGDPGSAVSLVSVKSKVLTRFLPPWAWHLLGALFLNRVWLPGWLGEPLLRSAQRIEELRSMNQRRTMMASDEAIEQSLSFAGKSGAGVDKKNG
jgi:preprotein translocase subunit SecA